MVHRGAKLWRNTKYPRAKQIESAARPAYTRWISVKAVLFLFILPCVAQQTPDPAFPDKERALGKQLAADVLKRGRPVESAEQIEYLRRTGDRLASQLPGTVWTFQAVIADSAEPMPFPGGIILVPDAFFGAARNDDEFAAMLAHSMGHIALRHGLRVSPLCFSPSGSACMPARRKRASRFRRATFPNSGPTSWKPISSL